MPLHEDDPNREGNLTDDEYAAATQALINEHGDTGLHTVPPDILAAAITKAKAQEGDGT